MPSPPRPPRRRRHQPARRDSPRPRHRNGSRSRSRRHGDCFRAGAGGRILPCGAARLILADQRLAARRLALRLARPGRFRDLRAEAPARRGAGHPEPPPDLPVADPGRPQLPGLLQHVPVQRARPARPARFTSAADPSRCAAACSVATYAADSPNTSATRLPPNPDRRATVIAKFRSTTSVSAYSASTAAPTIIRHRSPECSRCRPRGSGMSSSIACTMGRIPLPYSEFNKYAAHLMKKNRMSPDTQLKPSGDLGPAVGVRGGGCPTWRGPHER